MHKYVVATLLIVLGLAAGLSSILTSMPRPVVITPLQTAGSEPPEKDSVYGNGWNVRNVGGARLEYAYLRFRAWLGEPISAFDGQCQSFRFARLCYNPGNKEDWQIELTNGGWEDMLLEGYTPKPGSPPHPAVRHWKLAQLEGGADLTRIVGRTISDPICDVTSKLCKQWTDKQLFLFEQDAVTGDHVQRAPLGLWLVYPQSRVTATLPSELVPSQSPLPTLAVSAVLVLAGVSLLTLKNTARRSVAI